MKRTQHNNAFTIVELLTVMAVIALLIGLLVPALALVKDRAKDIQQRAQFHAISSGLEMFKADFGDYPDSKDNSYATPLVHPADPTAYAVQINLPKQWSDWTTWASIRIPILGRTELI